MASKNLYAISDKEFDEKVFKNSKPVLVDFWAEWCGPCRAIAPLLEELAAEHPEDIVIAKVNVDENSQYAGQFGVRGIPTLILFENGEQKGMVTGADPEKIRQLVKQAVA